MITNKHANRYAAVLTKINEKAICSYAELSNPVYEGLCEELWFATQNFINFCALTSKSSRNCKGERIDGNAERIRVLISQGIELDDIRSEILVHVISKMDYILKQPIEKQVNYTYRMVNNCVYDAFGKLPPADIKLVSLNDQVLGKSNSEEDNSELQDFISDGISAEDEVVAQETVVEKILAKKTEDEVRAKELKASIIKEISLLAQKPAEVFVRLACKHLALKPAKVATMLMEKGAVTAYAEVINMISKNYHISLSDIRFALGANMITDKALKVDTGDENKVRAQISRLTYRAEKNLHW